MKLFSYRAYLTLMSNRQTENKENRERKSVWLRHVANAVLHKHTVLFPLFAEVDTFI